MTLNNKYEKWYVLRGILEKFNYDCNQGEPVSPLANSRGLLLLLCPRRPPESAAVAAARVRRGDKGVQILLCSLCIVATRFSQRTSRDSCDSLPVWLLYAPDNYI